MPHFHDLISHLAPTIASLACPRGEKHDRLPQGVPISVARASGLAVTDTPSCVHGGIRRHERALQRLVLVGRERRRREGWEARVEGDHHVVVYVLGHGMERSGASSSAPLTTSWHR